MHHVNEPPGGSSAPAQPRREQRTLFGFVTKASAQEAADQLASASAKQKETADAEDAAAAAAAAARPQPEKRKPGRPRKGLAPLSVLLAPQPPLPVFAPDAGSVRRNWFQPHLFSSIMAELRGRRRSRRPEPRSRSAGARAAVARSAWERETATTRGPAAGARTSQRFRALAARSDDEQAAAEALRCTLGSGGAFVTYNSSRSAPLSPSPPRRRAP